MIAKIKTCVLGVALAVSTLAASASAIAASVGFDKAEVSVIAGETFTVDLVVDFRDDPTLGGGLDFAFDTNILEFVGFEFDSTLGLDELFGRVPDQDDGPLKGLAFGSFNGINGQGPIGTFSFRALVGGQAQVLPAVTDDALRGGAFISASDFTSEQMLDFGALQVNVSEVPVPAAFWLFSSAIFGALAAKARKG